MLARRSSLVRAYPEPVGEFIFSPFSISPVKRRVIDAFQKEFPVKKNKGGLVTNNFKGTF